MISISGHVRFIPPRQSLSLPSRIARPYVPEPPIPSNEHGLVSDSSKRDYGATTLVDARSDEQTNPCRTQITYPSAPPVRRPCHTAQRQRREQSLDALSMPRPTNELAPLQHIPRYPTGPQCTMRARSVLREYLRLWQFLFEVLPGALARGKPPGRL